jgi:hypothetical protein
MKQYILLKIFYALTVGVVIGLLGACTNRASEDINLSPTPQVFAFSEIRSLLIERGNKFKGLLRFSIEENQAQTGCYDIEKPIPIKVSFENVADAPLLIYTQYFIGPSDDNRRGPFFNVFPKIWDVNGQSISYDLGSVDVAGFGAKPESFLKLEPQETYDSVIDFHFPIFIRADNRYAISTLGTYPLQFVYVNSVIGPDADPPSFYLSDWNAWVGEVESNQIEICIENP